MDTDRTFTITVSVDTYERAMWLRDEVVSNLESLPFLKRDTWYVGSIIEPALQTKETP